MKPINTQGILYIESFDNTADWYWGTDYAHGDLYEAEDAFYQNFPIKSNRLIFIDYPEGDLYEPIIAKEGQYLGRPIFYENQIVILLVDFLAKDIRIISFDVSTKEVSSICSLPLSSVKDCYNLMLHTAPLMLTRQANDDVFQIIWPERKDITIGSHESFDFREGNDLYFADWYEDEHDDYWEEIVIRDYHTGETKERIPGCVRTMPDGQRWLLK